AGGVALAAFAFSTSVRADDGALMDMVKNMQSQMNEMAKTIRWQGEKIQDLESHQGGAAVSGAPETPASPVMMTESNFNSMLDQATGGASKWIKDLKFSGDLRLRYEGFHYNSGNPSETDDRNRFRYRLRYGFEKKMNDQMNIGFFMASGEQSAGANNDPNSTNTTFDNNFNFKPIFIERAWATYKPKFLSNIGPLKTSEITAGKMANPFEKGSSDIIWDRDIRPEGVYEKFDFMPIDSEDFGLDAYATTGQFILDEDATVGGDANLFAYQVGLQPSFRVMDTPVKWLHAFSLYNFNNYARMSNFLTGGGASLARTNPNVDSLSTELDAGEFNVIEYYSEIGFPTIHSLPFTGYLDLAGNVSDAADGFHGATIEHSGESDFAWALGLKLGSVKKKHDWELGYQYKVIGVNAVPAAFNDSDFGDGFTGRRGSVLKLGYGITDSLTFGTSMYFVDNLNAGTAGILDQQQRRLQVDLAWKF
ncbi:MAG TPA: putative porin, partial [Verrucomicrobiae bacterium]|nr:putative porin [Verrucomicrobiae bacterium]